MAEVVLADPEAAGLDSMLAGLLQSAITDPAKAAILDRMAGAIELTVPDADVVVGLVFAGGRCEVRSGPLAHAQVRMSVPSEQVMSLSTIPLLLGMPSVRTPEGRAFTRDVLTRRIRIRGLRHVGLITALNRLLSLV